MGGKSHRLWPGICIERPVTTSLFFLSILALYSAENIDLGSLIPSRSTVVLMTGLPGDIESENAYREQMQDWLDLIPTTVNKVITLSDFSEALKRPRDREVSFLKSDRKSFESLGSTLESMTNPIVFVIWGHGGKQGSTPVFHVRGPRLSPSDFQNLAKKNPRLQSRWVLLFRGSSAFASELAGLGRAILASESGTMFNSDPVSMPLLIKLLKGNPGMSLNELADGFGQATGNWYEERHLAATEEPSLWWGNDKPRLLSSALSQNALASGQRLSHTNTPPQPSLAQSDLPPIWKGINREQPSKFPGADAILLRRRVHYTLANHPAVATEQEEFIQIFTVEGKKFGDYDISYTPPFEEIQFLDCEVLRPDGTLTRLDLDLIREQQQESLGDYQLTRRKFFSLPGVVPGAIVHVRHRTEWQTFPLPHVSLEIPITGDLPTVDVGINVTIPKDAAFHFAFEKIVAADPAVVSGTYGTTYSWKFDNLPAPIQEPLAPPRQHPRLFISTFPDWAAFAGWYGRICKLSDAATPEIAAKAAELAGQKKTDREKAIALYNYVTSLRYVAVPLGVNSFRPHTAANVLNNQFGDCKDKANLFNALLHTLNIKAYLVLVPRFSQAYDNVPGLAFNHAISQVWLEGKPEWADTTDDVCRFGLLPPGDAGRKGLIIDGKSTSLVELPFSGMQDHVLRIKARVDCKKPADPLPMVLEANASGYFDYELRNTAQISKAQFSSFPLLARLLRPLTGFFALNEQLATRVSALEESFSCQLQGSWIGGISLRESKYLLAAPFWIPNQWNLALHHRKSPLFLNDGYPLMLEEEFEFKLPPQSRLEPLPAVNENKSGQLQWRAEWTKVDNDKILARFHAELLSPELSAEGTLDFQNQLRRLLLALGTGVSLTEGP